MLLLYIKKRGLEDLTKDESDGSAFPTTQIHDRVMNAIEEGSFSEAVVAHVVTVTTVGVGGDCVGGKWNKGHDFIGSFCTFVVDKSVGSADER